MHGHELLHDIGLAIIVSTATGFLFHKLRQPIILGYLVAGIIIGPEFGSRLITNTDNIEIISELGLILLLFIIGLELNPQRLLSTARQILLAGLAQFWLTILMGFGFFFIFSHLISRASVALPLL